MKRTDIFFIVLLLLILILIGLNIFSIYLNVSIISHFVLGNG